MILRALSRSSRPQPRWLSSLREAERAPSVVLIGPPVEKECQKAIVSTEALAFIDLLSRQFDDRRRELVAQRTNPRLAYDAKTADLRDSEWQVHALPFDLLDRKVEITGPPTPSKMVINALNANATCYMADFEDSLSPTWHNVLDGQANLKAAVRGELCASSGAKEYVVNPDCKTVLHVRPRGLHLEEKHVLVDGVPVGASLFDFGMYAFHNAKLLESEKDGKPASKLARGTYIYVPKLESAEEAALWRDVFNAARAALGLLNPIRCSVLIETLPAAFQMEEILHVLRNNISALNCGRWDYIFSAIKHRSNSPEVGKLPDRSKLTMETGFLAAYSKELIRVCHKRGALAMGGMATQIPIKNDFDANAAALEVARLDKVREATNGHDGTWVAHPALVDIATQVFNSQIGWLKPNQIEVGRAAAMAATPAENRAHEALVSTNLTTLPVGDATAAGVEYNVEVLLQYVDAWLGGNGCVALHHKMEDAATAELSRAQLWAQLKHATPVVGADGKPAGVVDLERIRAAVEKVQPTLSKAHGDGAIGLFQRGLVAAPFEPFLTPAAYDYIVNDGR